MNKEKLKHLPFNAIWHLMTALLMYSLLSAITEWNFLTIFLLVFMFYSIKVGNGVDNDYTQEQINNLKK